MKTLSAPSTTEAVETFITFLVSGALAATAASALYALL